MVSLKILFLQVYAN